ncbi:MAG: hypothetical protein ACRD82_01700 [Blastocatellia bacterium]
MIVVSRIRQFERDSGKFQQFAHAAGFDGLGIFQDDVRGDLSGRG